MLSSASIQAVVDEKTEEARALGLTPTVITKKALKRWPPFPFPFLGEYVPDGWRIAEDINGGQVTLFVDKTGDGAAWEPALTVDQLKARLAKFAKSEDTWGIGIVEEGEMQIVLGLYKPDFGDFTQSGNLTKQERADVLAGNRYHNPGDEK